MNQPLSVGMSSLKPFCHFALHCMLPSKLVPFWQSPGFKRKKKTILHCCFIFKPLCRCTGYTWVVLQDYHSRLVTSSPNKPSSVGTSFHPSVVGVVSLAVAGWWVSCAVLSLYLISVLYCWRESASGQMKNSRALSAAKSRKRGQKKKMCQGTLTCVKVSLARQDILTDFMYYISVHRYIIVLSELENLVILKKNEQDKGKIIFTTTISGWTPAVRTCMDGAMHSVTQ